MSYTDSPLLPSLLPAMLHCFIAFTVQSSSGGMEVTDRSARRRHRSLQGDGEAAEGRDEEEERRRTGADAEEGRAGG